VICSAALTAVEQNSPSTPTPDKIWRRIAVVSSSEENTKQRSNMLLQIRGRG
jgi:hypothetical protein